MGLSGIPWWTTDIGGFHGGNPNDPKFREVRLQQLELIVASSNQLFPSIPNSSWQKCPANTIPSSSLAGFNLVPTVP